MKRPKLRATDRFVWAWLSSVWDGWQSGVFIVKAATVIGWHCKGFGLFWSGKIGPAKGRPSVPKEVHSGVLPTFTANFSKLGIDVGETSVSKYLVRSRKPPSQTW